MSHADLIAEALDVADGLATHGNLIGASYLRQLATALQELEWKPIRSHPRGLVLIVVLLVDGNRVVMTGDELAARLSPRLRSHQRLAATHWAMPRQPPAPG